MSTAPIWFGRHIVGARVRHGAFVCIAVLPILLTTDAIWSIRTEKSICFSRYPNDAENAFGGFFCITDVGGQLVVVYGPDQTKDVASFGIPGIGTPSKINSLWESFEFEIRARKPEDIYIWDIAGGQSPKLITVNWRGFYAAHCFYNNWEGHPAFGLLIYSTAWAVPHWFLIVVSLIPAIIVYRRWVWSFHRNRETRRGRCLSCGYNLRGSLASERCPECGQEITDDDRQRIAKAVAREDAAVVESNR